MDTCVTWNVYNSKFFNFNQFDLTWKADWMKQTWPCNIDNDKFVEMTTKDVANMMETTQVIKSSFKPMSQAPYILSLFKMIR